MAARISPSLFTVAVLLVLGCRAARVAAQEALANGSFEVTTGLVPAPVNGNNFYANPPGWITSPANTTNLVKPFPGYASNATTTPAGGGAYYLDLNSAGATGTIRQSVSVTTPGVFSFSAWFSVRDRQQALTGTTINIRDASNAVVATATTAFAATDPIGLWKQALVSNVVLGAGNYTFEIVLPDPANVDLASFLRLPPLSVSKTSAPYSDPITGTTAPKLLPGGVVEYTLRVANPSSYAVTADSVVLVDQTPANLELAISSIGPGPAIFTQGAPSSTLSYTFSSLDSMTDDLDFSYDNGATWTGAPSAAAIAAGYDPAITQIRLRPKGTMAAGSSFTFRLRYRIK